jgi:xanthine/CO dehydrogenase XdhC/CoxF family maturation factor
MNEIEAIVSLATEACVGEALAMATVVKVQGSAYRRPGARMLLSASGRSVGMISGGCLDADVRERARRVMATGRPSIVTYDSTAPDEIVFGLGLGCGGVVTVLIEPLTVGDETGLIALMQACGNKRQSGTIATVFHTEGACRSIAPGTRLLCWPDGSMTSNSDDPEVRKALLAAVYDTAGRRSALRVVELPGGVADVLIETIAPPVPLLIFGAGDDAIPVARLATSLGWHVTVVDARPAYAVPDRFPGVAGVYCVQPEALSECAEIGLFPDALAIIMTHSYSQDKELVRALVPRKLRYVGLLGPKARARRLLDELEEEGTTFARESLARLRAPVGLDIGAETPEEIALSILAEMQAALTDRAGGPLQHRRCAIHEPVEHRRGEREATCAVAQVATA